ncbi:MAG TPA: Crp/Fnr family transcriptional regulator, partial [Roseomonas sp.]|nr:Crp/Fnr family transcriptional regulator [Roseomonas sp.]
LDTGQAAYRIEDEPGGMYGLAAGALGVLVGEGGRAPRLAHVARPGAWLGHGPLMAGGRRVLGLRAMEPTVALLVPLAALQALALDSAEATRAFAVLVNANMGLLTTAVSDLLIPRADRRIAAVLLRVAGAQGDRPTPPRALSQADLGEMANASRQLVNRTLLGFAARGWVALDYRRIALLDPVELAAFAGES